MTPEQRRRLEQLKSVSRQRMARAEAGQYLRPLLPRLRQEGCRCRRIGVTALSVTLQRVTELEGRDERVLWAGAKPGACYTWENIGQRDRVFGMALAELARPSDKVVVAWHTNSAGLLMRAGDAARLASLILEPSPVVWVVPIAGPAWLIEAAHFDREICSVRLTEDVDDGRPAMPLRYAAGQ